VDGLAGEARCRESIHDDLVLAVALACWHGQNAPALPFGWLRRNQEFRNQVLGAPAAPAAASPSAASPEDRRAFLSPDIIATTSPYAQAERSSRL
jgi:hypothetical protein